MKLIGALGVILAGTLMGVLAVMRLHRRQKAQEQTILWLSDLERRLAYTMPPLREFLAETAGMSEYAALTFIPAILRELDRTDMASAFAAALRAALPGAELDGVHSGLHFLLTLPGAGGERAMVEAAARQGVRLRGLSEYYLARTELCRPDTVVAGYSALREEDVQAVAQALARAWLCAPGNG